MDNFLYVFNAIFPLILIIALGFILKKTKLFPESFISSASKVIFYVFLPCLIFLGVYTIDPETNFNIGAIIVFIFASTLFLFFLTFLLNIFFVKENNQKGVLLQAAVRGNITIIGLGLALALGGVPALGYASVVAAISIPLSNTLAVIGLSIYSGQKLSIVKILKSIILNPLTLAIIAGFIMFGIKILVLNSTGKVLEELVPPIYTFIESLSQITTPFALLILGGQLELKKISEAKGVISLGVIIRIIISPLIGYLALFFIFNHFMEITPAVILGLLPMLASPVAVTSAIMAKEMGSDDTLASSIVVISTILSIFTIFIVCLLFKNMGLI